MTTPVARAMKKSHKEEDTRPFTGLLIKKIDPGEAKPRGLRAALALPPDDTDVQAHREAELSLRFAKLYEFLGVSASDADHSMRMAKALLERNYGIPQDAANWWELLAWHLTAKHVPGFSRKKADKKKHGAPREWTWQPLMQLFADVELWKKKTGKSVSAICRILPTQGGYSKRWGLWRNKSGALSKAYAKANKLFQQDLTFRLMLCGPEASMRGKDIDLIQAAIERHALQI